MRPLRVCSFESRKQAEMRSLIERNGGLATIAASMREVPLENNAAVFRFLEELQADRIDVVIFMTGVGARALRDVVITRVEEATFFDWLQRCCIFVRGPKPTAVLREWGVRIDHRAPEPNTWRELLSVIDCGLSFPASRPVPPPVHNAPLSGRTVALQEYGQPSVELHAALTDRGAKVLPVPVYRWELPTDTAPLQAALHELVAGKFDILLFTSAQQARNVLQVAQQLGIRDQVLEAASRCRIHSIGPTCTAALQESGFRVDHEASHPHMGQLVREALADEPQA
jgi:uroporphyrinogen-III synthase